MAIRCTWSEHASAKEAAREYGWTPDSEYEQEWEKEAIEWLQLQTQVIEFEKATGGAGVIVAGF